MLHVTGICNRYSAVVDGTFRIFHFICEERLLASPISHSNGIDVCKSSRGACCRLFRRLFRRVFRTLNATNEICQCVKAHQPEFLSSVKSEMSMLTTEIIRLRVKIAGEFNSHGQGAPVTNIDTKQATVEDCNT